MGSFLVSAGKMLLLKTITLLIVILLVLTIEFLFFRVGGSYAYGPPKAALPELHNEYTKHLHLNESILAQYFYFLGDMLTGGGSFEVPSQGGGEVGDALRHSLPHTVMMFGLALVFSLLLGFLGAYVLWKIKSRAVKAIGMASALISWTLPVILVAGFFLVQIIWRFGINWGFRDMLYSPGDSWINQFGSDIKDRLFPVIILVIVTIGGFTLILLEGLRSCSRDTSRVQGSEVARTSSYSESILSVLPMMKLNIAFLMSCVIVVEVFWILDGLGHRVVAGWLNADMPVVDAGIFLILLIVLVSGFLLDMILSLFAIHWRSSHSLRRSSEGLSPGGDSHAPHSLRQFSNGLVSASKSFLSRFFRSPAGVLGAIFLIAIAVIAFAGSFVSEPSDPFNREGDAVSQFLALSGDQFGHALFILVASMLIGFFAGLSALPLGKFNYPVLVVAESFVIIPMLGIGVMASVVGSTRISFDWFVILVAWAPIALCVIRRGSTFSTGSQRQSAKSRFARYSNHLKGSFSPALANGVRALKYVAVVVPLSILILQYAFGFHFIDSWGAMISYGISGTNIFHFNIWWILPLVGTVMMVSGFYLVLDATQRIIEESARQATCESQTQSPNP